MCFNFGNMLVETVNINLTLIVFIIILLCYLIWRKKYARFYQLLGKFKPIKKTYPLIGHAYLFYEGLTAIIKICNEFRDLSKPLILWIGPRPLILINKPGHLEVVFNDYKSINKPQEVKMFGEFLDGGLVFTDNPQWRRDRKLLNRIFHQKNLESHVDIFRKQSKLVVDNLQGHCDYEFDISAIMCKHFFNIFFETSIGLDAENYQKEFLTKIQRFSRILMGRVFNPIMHFRSVFYNTPKGKEVLHIIKTIMNISSDIFDEKLKMYQKENNSEETKKTRMLMDYLIELYINENAFTKNEILSEITIFISAGFETCTPMSSFVFIMLGLYQDEQEKLYEEILKVEALNDRLDFKSLSHLTYMEKFIKETMRLFPVAPLLARSTTEEMDLGDVILPADTPLLINVFGLHRCEKYYNNPLVFDPERFNVEETAKRPRFSYLPFSGGPRDCIGKTFAMLSMKMLFAHVIKNFQISTSYKNIESIKLEQTLAINAIDGYPVTLRKR